MILKKGSLALGLWMVSALAYGADISTAVEYYDQGNFDAAKTELRTLVTENPEDPMANLYLGRILIKDKAYAEAEPILQKAVAADNAQARTELGKVHMYQEKLPEAVNNFKAALADEGEQKNPDLFLNYGMTLLKQKKASEAATQLEKAVELDDNNAYAHYYLGLAHNEQGRADQMLIHFRKFVELAPDSPEAARVRSLLRTR